jgi:hypothetical protein
MSYGTDVPDLYRRGAAYVDCILRGTMAGDLPVQNPTCLESTDPGRLGRAPLLCARSAAALSLALHHR